MVPPCSDKVSRAPPYSRIKKFVTHTGLSPSTARLSRRFWFKFLDHWPGPRSLATTNGVSVDVLSSGYLDVSVRRVCFLHLCIQCRMTLTGRVSPFGNPRIKACSQLPAAYRSVLRPSSPLSAKASTKCPFALDCRVITYRDKPRSTTSLIFSVIFGSTKQSRLKKIKSRIFCGVSIVCNLFTMCNN